MKRFQPFHERGGDALFHLLDLEEERSRMGRQRGFAILRIEARSAETVAEMLALYRAVAGALRRSDRVQAVGGRALAAVLSDTGETQADAIGSRVRHALAMHGGRWRPLLGWACTRPERTHSWKDAWQTAGMLLTADGRVPAAA